MTIFKELGLSPELLTTLEKMGYENPTPVQAQSIPILLAGHDLVAQAETGTGKTAAFALPILMKIDVNLLKPQALILAPTRELAIQVADALQSYAKHLKNFHVLPIYGGQSYTVQLNALKRGVQVIVGTPGRVMDHLRRKTLILDHLNMLILDEADEMLKMGFQQDVEWILEQIPGEHQTALFSATMPAFIKKLANNYLNNPQKVHVTTDTQEIPAITQYCAFVSPKNKVEALTRFLEVEDCDAAIIFVRTKTASQELADKLSARGYAVAALNGDVKQAQREMVINKLKKGLLDIVVATDVAARGIDVPRIDLVVNYDAPHDTESYIHRIGRTGRAGRKGNALLFITPREKRLLADIEHATKQPVTMVVPPSLNEISAKQFEEFSAVVINAVRSNALDDARVLVEELAHKAECSELDIAAALVTLTYQPKSIDERDIEWFAKDDKPEKAPRNRRSRNDNWSGERRRSSDRGGDRSEGRRSSERSNRGEGRRSSDRGGDRSEGRRSSDRGGDRSEGRRSSDRGGDRSEGRRSSERSDRSEGRRSSERSNRSEGRQSKSESDNRSRTADQYKPEYVRGKFGEEKPVKRIKSETTLTRKKPKTNAKKSKKSR